MAKQSGGMEAVEEKMEGEPVSNAKKEKAEGEGSSKKPSKPVSKKTVANNQHW